MKKIILVGAGVMAIDYDKVLTHLNIDFDVVGRGEISAIAFHGKTGKMPFVGGLESYLKKTTIEKGTYAIVATGTEYLLKSLFLLFNAGVEKILIEKPAALSIDELLDSEESLRPYFDKVFVAYNRRFYQSVQTAKKLIAEDGGIKTMHFEFTEWSHLITDAAILPEVKANWFFANSTHVIDLAFFIGGRPTEIACFSKTGNLSWHDKTNFSGAGITQNGVIFSYVSNWESAGRWSVEVMSDKRRFILKPLEGILVQIKGSVVIEPLEFNNEIDIQFKPGLYLQVKSFIEQNDKLLLNIQEHISNTKEIYSKILS
jgi:hypothetical protein